MPVAAPSVSDPLLRSGECPWNASFILLTLTLALPTQNTTDFNKSWTRDHLHRRKRSQKARARQICGTKTPVSFLNVGDLEDLSPPTSPPSIPLLSEYEQRLKLLPWSTNREYTRVLSEKRYSPWSLPEVNSSGTRSLPLGLDDLLMPVGVFTPYNLHRTYITPRLMLEPNRAMEVAGAAVVSHSC